MNREALYIFMIGVVIGMYLSDILGAMAYRDSIRDIPEFLKEKEK